MPLPFEQQTRESHKAFAAFSLYLSLGPQRSLAAVGRKLGKSKVVIERWSAKFDWVTRIQAHAAHLAVVEREATEAVARGSAAVWGKRQQEVRQEEWELHAECIQAGREALKRFYEKGKGATLGDIARILELASTLGRLASGLATDKMEITGEAGRPVRIEVTLALEKIYGQPIPGEVATPPAYVDVEEMEKGEGRMEKADQRRLTSAATEDGK